MPQGKNGIPFWTSHTLDVAALRVRLPIFGTESALVPVGSLETQASSRFGQTSEIHLARVARIELQLLQPRLVAATEAF
jgi:hypothetical protein